MRMVFCTLISLISRQFIHLKANCMNSTFSDSRCAARGAVFIWRLLLDSLRRQVELTIDPGYKFGYSLDATMNPGLAVDIVVLDSVEEPRQTPERVGFHGV